MHRAFSAHPARVKTIDAEKRHFRTCQLVGHSIGQDP